jgi:phosphatidylserine/phosphatidylglycerophosphate/cardiolipin synthase-like enzyme
LSRRRTSNTQLILTVVIVIAAAIFYLVDQYQARPAPASAPTSAMSTKSASTRPAATSTVGSANLSWLTVYFTNPNPPDNIGHSIDQYVQSAIDGATKSIDVTSFEFNLPSVINALSSAARRGVKVRVVYDGSNGGLSLDNSLTEYKTFNTIPTLKAAGVGLVDAGREYGIMHDKIVIVDGKTLYMGSWNLAYNDTYRNNNNLLKITDPQIIANYQAKFNELFVDKKFGNRTVVKAPAPNMVIDGTAVENYFSPADDVMDKLIRYVSGARKSIHFMAFTFTYENLANAIIERSKAGLDVQGVIEGQDAAQGVMAYLYCARTPVKVDGNKYIMHHKVIIIDGQVVITGSFNFTRSADVYNDENVVVIHNAAIAAQYEQEYQRVLSIAQNPSANETKCGK